MRLILVVLLSLLFSAPTSAQEQEEPARLALIIANQNYEEAVGPLRNPHNDARLISAALESQGFDVDVQLDVSRSFDFLRVVERFADRLAEAPGSVGFFMFSGHGASFGESDVYLVPTSVQTVAECPARCVPVSELDASFRSLSPESAHILVFDVGREELLLPQSRGFADTLLPYPYGLLAFSTRPGTSALDRFVYEGREEEGGSPYAIALSQSIVEAEGALAEEVFARTAHRFAIRFGTSGQAPVFTSSLSIPVVFGAAPPSPGAEGLSAPPAESPPAVSCEPEDARQLFEAVENSEVPEELEAVARACPQSPQAILARVKAENLRNAPPQPAPAATEQQAEEQAEADPLPELDRVALLIGNATYAHESTLRNPPNDVAAMRRALELLGFDVLEPVIDADRDTMARILELYYERAAEADTAVLYYSGHGIQMDGRNYVIPVDAQLLRPQSVRFQAIELASAIDAAAGAERLSVVIFDACRENRFPTGTRGQMRGFGQVVPRPGQIVAFSTAFGALASDGDGDLSPYTQALTDMLSDERARTMDVGLLFREAHARVVDRHAQQPELMIASGMGTQITLTGLDPE